MSAQSTSTRDRILGAAVSLTAARGWSKVTMGQLAADAGVSRQTVYNEVGSKEGLAEAMILRELEAFLARVEASFDTHADDLVEAITEAVTQVLEHAHDNQLLKAVVSATHGADTELLPLLTTHSASLLQAAKDVIQRRIEPFEVDLPDEQQDAAIEAVVRLVLSHIMQPSASPQITAAHVGWIVDRVMR